MLNVRSDTPHPIDILEHAFENERVSPPSPATDLDRVRALQSRIAQMQRTRIDTASLATHPALTSLLPGGALQAGAAYSVIGSTTLLTALLAGPSGDGAWCGIVGVPEFGAEAAGRCGVDLERLVMVPHPGEHWLSVTAALADAVTVVVIQPGGRVREADAARLAARLRQRESTLIALGDWPGVMTRLTMTESRWSGLGRGHGYPQARIATVTAGARDGAGTMRSAQLWLPDDRGRIRLATARESSRDQPHLLEAVG